MTLHMRKRILYMILAFSLLTSIVVIELLVQLFAP
uniref:Uncharacterized protein n=1 Tax=Rhizophora mucronata TaxID=61149 RepID=A0A2P2P2A6_RHIMU